MRLKIKHFTQYSYTSAVFVEPQYLYMYPSQRPHITLLDYKLEVTPTPSGISIRQDSESNFYHQCWFNDLIDRVEIKMQMEVKVKHINPFDFLVENKKSDYHNTPLEIYLRQEEKLNTHMISWLNEFKNASGENTIAFLSSLCTEINSEWDHTIRYEDHLLSPIECFTSKSGSCRDLSWLLIQLLRNSGFPARFVSGYANNPELEEGHELHAWVEVWLDGSGWLGIDPTAGLFTTEHYIPVATSYLPKSTLPVQGSYRGEATSNLSTEVKIIELP